MQRVGSWPSTSRCCTSYTRLRRGTGRKGGRRTKRAPYVSGSWLLYFDDLRKAGERASVGFQTAAMIWGCRAPPSRLADVVTLRKAQ